MVLESICFCPLTLSVLRPSRLAVKARIDEDSWRISRLVATYEGIFLARFTVFTYALKTRVRWIRSRSRTHSDV